MNVSHFVERFHLEKEKLRNTKRRLMKDVKKDQQFDVYRDENECGWLQRQKLDGVSVKLDE